MKLYHMPGACSLAGLIVLGWVGAPHATVKMSADSIKSPEYLAMNPSGAVPLLGHGDFLLTENIAILGDLADLHPEARLLGDGTSRRRAEVMRWLGFLNSDVHKAFKPLFQPARFLQKRNMDDELALLARGHVIFTASALFSPAQADAADTAADRPADKPVHKPVHNPRSQA